MKLQVRHSSYQQMSIIQQIVTWTEIDNDPLEDILSVENILESRITSHENSILDNRGLQVESFIDQENISFYPNVERIIENDLEDQYLNNFSQSESKLNEEELFNSDILQKYYKIIVRYKI